MQQRTIPYGYEIQDGEIVMQTNEATIVRYIFSAYLAGDSFRRIVEKLLAKGEYYLIGIPWNKNHVARLLANEKYTGAGQFPAIISAEEYRAVLSIRNTKQPIITKPEVITEIQKVVCCSQCGVKLVRLANQKGHERWKCENCGAISHTVRDVHLIAGVSKLLHALPSKLRSPQASRQQSLDIMRLQNELDRMLDNPEHDEAQTKALIMEFAAEKYALLGNEEYETERMRRLLESLPHTAELNTDLFRQVVSEVFVSPSGEVAIKLKNNQIIERNDLS